ncbi:unnamed protein product [Caenorhabditis angaria]|uniref:Protein-tyrosine-phosphatase n=1 Tax=Caenorhabditis angaria TaxID=860376 RepID=B6VBX7_9PELO|nr:hypothetical protein Csp3_JD05.005 [Caenorhabditis angaria]CAI5438514.1 unnamed protein product [Caenorhabditis angaria]
MSNVPKMKKAKQTIRSKSSTSASVAGKSNNNLRGSETGGKHKLSSPNVSQERETRKNTISKGRTPRRELEESSSAIAINAKSTMLTSCKVLNSQDNSDRRLVALTKNKSQDKVAKGNKKKLKENEERNSGENSDTKGKQNEIAQKWVDSTILAGLSAMRMDFKSCKNTVTNEECTAFHKNMTKNRYPNVPCLDKTRFILTDDPNFYIHANRVRVCPSQDRYICTQAPLASTIEDFWKMVLSSDTGSIIMLCALIEEGASKCAKYFPDSGQTMDLSQFKIINESTNVFNQPDSKDKVQQSQLKIIWKSQNNKEYKLSHYLWTNWPDHGMPEKTETLLAVLDVIRKDVKAVVVHCSAGVGRTGTFVLVESIIMSLTYPSKLVVRELFARLRADRAKMVQTLPQFIFAIRCALEYAYSNFSVKKNTVEWDKFNDEYTKFMAKKRKKPEIGKLRKKASSVSCENDDDEKEAVPPHKDEPLQQKSNQPPQEGSSAAEVSAANPESTVQ